MKTRQATTNEPSLSFEVDGASVDATGWHWYPHRWGGGMFGADFAEVGRLLPSPPLHPLRLRRASVCVWGAHYPAVGREPPFFGFGELAVMAFVTRGDESAPPVVPALGKRAMIRHGFGVYMLLSVVTNRVAAETHRMLLGIPALVGDIRHEQRLDHERFVCEMDDQLVCDLTVRSDGKPTVGTSPQSLYVAEGDEVYTTPLGESGVSRVTYRRNAATLKLGNHPLAEQLRRLRLSRSWVSEFVPDRHFWLTGPPVAVERTPNPPVTPAETGLIQGRLVTSPTEGVEIEKDQGLESLRFNPTGTYTGPTLHQRSVAQHLAP